MLEGSPALTAKNSSTAPTPTSEVAADAGVIDPDTLDRTAVLPNFTALVVEDNLLIAMDAEMALIELGATTVQLCPNVANALATIDKAFFDVALLDVNLSDETSEPVAMALRNRGIPFVMTTGFGDYISDIAAYARAPVLTKPYAPAALAQALVQVMAPLLATSTQAAV